MFAPSQRIRASSMKSIAALPSSRRRTAVAEERVVVAGAERAVTGGSLACRGPAGHTGVSVGERVLGYDEEARAGDRRGERADRPQGEVAGEWGVAGLDVGDGAGRGERNREDARGDRAAD